MLRIDSCSHGIIKVSHGLFLLGIDCAQKQSSHPPDTSSSSFAHYTSSRSRRPEDCSLGRRFAGMARDHRHESSQIMARI